ncbi:MAG: hypothetical protein V3V20_07945 [Algisphaera sp.]
MIDETDPNETHSAKSHLFKGELLGFYALLWLSPIVVGFGVGLMPYGSETTTHPNTPLPIFSLMWVPYGFALLSISALILAWWHPRVVAPLGSPPRHRWFRTILLWPLFWITQTFVSIGGCACSMSSFNNSI